MAGILHFLNRDALAAALSGPEGLCVAYTMYTIIPLAGTHRQTLNRIHTVMPCISILRPDATEVEVVVMVGGHQASHTTERSSRHVQNGSSAASACSAPK